MDAHPVHDRRHAVLADPEMDVAAALVLGAELVRRFELRAVAGGEVRRAADELGHGVEDRVEDGVGRGAARDAAILFREIGDLALPVLRKVTDQPAVQAVASRLGAQPSQVGLAWLLARADNVLLIPGTSSVAHLEENMQTADLKLSEEDLAELSAVATPAVR